MLDSFLFVIKWLLILIILAISCYVLGRAGGLGFMKSITTSSKQQRKRNPNG
jgi:hypothetical protein